MNVFIKRNKKEAYTEEVFYLLLIYIYMAKNTLK
jgi:hypothetical protein